MAVFESQISAQVTQGQKDDLGEVLRADQEVVSSTSEADVIRAAIELGMPLLRGIAPAERCRKYALQRRGLRLRIAAE